MVNKPYVDSLELWKWRRSRAQRLIMLITHENSGSTISPFVSGWVPDKELMLLSAPFGEVDGSANIWRIILVSPQVCRSPVLSCFFRKQVWDCWGPQKTEGRRFGRTSLSKGGNYELEYRYGAQWIIWLQSLHVMSLLGEEGKPRQLLCCQQTDQSVICPAMPWSRGCGRDKERLEALSSPCTVLERARKVFLEGCSLGNQRRLSIWAAEGPASPSWCLEGDGLWRLSILYKGDMLHLLMDSETGLG